MQGVVEFLFSSPSLLFLSFPPKGSHFHLFLVYLSIVFLKVM